MEVFYMQRIPKRRYTAEFRAEAVKLVLDQKVGLAEAARRLDLPAKSLANWVRAARAGKPVKVQEAVHQVSDLEAEVSRLRAENARLKMEREILRKAAAYFAKDAL
jgi:transposase